ncbi:YcjF family protein [Pantanalinema rosaneae CENA516]|uniref:YcjF family protein n=1 Tax=Pantanalinema rosaneae TaxID=1620701 RepID=UPI003D6EB4B5
MNLDEIWSYINGDFSDCNDEERQKLCSQIRVIAGGAAAALALAPVPFADIFTITPVQYLMVRAIGNIYGYKISEKSVGEIVAVIGGGFLGQQTILALFKIGLPGAGGLVGSTFVYGWTYGIGKAAELYFSSGMTATKEDLKRARESGAKEGEQSYREHESENAELKQKIEFFEAKGFNEEEIIFAIWNITPNHSDYIMRRNVYRKLKG